MRLILAVPVAAGSRTKTVLFSGGEVLGNGLRIVTRVIAFKPGNSAGACAFHELRKALGRELILPRMGNDRLASGRADKLRRILNAQKMAADIILAAGVEKALERILHAFGNARLDKHRAKCGLPMVEPGCFA